MGTLVLKKIMASLFKRQRSPYWWVKYRDPQNPVFNASGKIVARRESTGFRHSHSLETRKAREVEAEKTLLERKSAGVSARESWDCWVKQFLALRCSGLSLDRYNTAWRTVRLFLLENHVLVPRQLTRTHCFNYFDWRKNSDKGNGKYRAGHNTALFEMKLLGLIMKEAVLRNFAPFNSARELGIKKAPRRKRPAYTDAQLKIIERAIQREPEPRRTILLQSYLIGRYHGARLNETWVNPMIDVDIFTVKTADGKRAKSGAIRFVQKGDRHEEKLLHPRLIPVFEKLKASKATENFPKPKKFSGLWMRFLARCGIKAQSPNACFHALRNTAVTRLERAGVQPTLAMAYLTHSDAKVHEAYKRRRIEDYAVCHGAL
jgi:integrase